MTEAWQEFRVSNDCIKDAGELKRRLDDDGYLFFRKLQNRDKLLALRLDMTRVLHAGGWLVPDADPMLGIADVSRRTTEGDLEYNPVYFQIQRLESFHSLPHERELLDVVERIMGKQAIPLPGKKARIWFPRFTEHTTPLHQDFVHYQGSVQTLTCWSPVGDCPIELGPLAVLPGSHKVKKVLPHHFSLGAGGLIIDLNEADAEASRAGCHLALNELRDGRHAFLPSADRAQGPAERYGRPHANFPGQPLRARLAEGSPSTCWCPT